MSESIRNIELRIKRAELHIRELEKLLIRKFLRPLPTTRHLDTEKNEIVISLASDLPTVPSDFNLICGEVLYQLRCSLDNLIYALVIESGGEPTRDTAFPIYLNLSDYEKQSERKLKGVGQYVETFIRSRQPFGFIPTEELVLNEEGGLKLQYREPTDEELRQYERHPLWILNKLNNADKHRFTLKLGISSTLGTVSTNDFHVSRKGRFIKQDTYCHGSECYRYPAQFPGIEWETAKIEFKPAVDLLFDEMDGIRVKDAMFSVLGNIKRYVTSTVDIAKELFFEPKGIAK